MNKDEVVKMNYLLCDVLTITMDLLNEVPLPVLTKWRKTAAAHARDIYEEELLMNSITFNTISVLNQEMETMKLCRKDKDDIEYKMVLRWLTNRVRELENE